MNNRTQNGRERVAEYSGATLLVDDVKSEGEKHAEDVNKANPVVAAHCVDAHHVGDKLVLV